MKDITANEVDVYVGQRTRHLREVLVVIMRPPARYLRLPSRQPHKTQIRTNRAGAGRLYMIADFLDVPVQYFYEGLADGDSPRMPHGATVERNSELVALNDAFRSISDPDTRRSVVALVCSLAAAEPETQPRAMARLARSQDLSNGLRHR
jgi:hypothetical protein